MLKQDEGNPAHEEIWPCAIAMASQNRLDRHPHLTGCGMLAGAKHPKKTASPSTGTIYPWQGRVPGRHGGAALSAAASQLQVPEVLTSSPYQCGSIWVLRFSQSGFRSVAITTRIEGTLESLSSLFSESWVICSVKRFSQSRSIARCLCVCLCFEELFPHEFLDGPL